MITRRKYFPILGIAVLVVQTQSVASMGQSERPALKWELVSSPSGTETLSADDDPYRTWESPQVVMKGPEQFTELPRTIRDELLRRRCRVPQELQTKRVHNLIWGEFDRRGQRDLAVICVQGRTAVALMFWAGNARRVEQLPFEANGSTLTVATAADVERHAPPNAKVTSDAPHLVEHDVIEVACCECCSSYYYRHFERWYRAAGAD